MVQPYLSQQDTVTASCGSAAREREQDMDIRTIETVNAIIMALFFLCYSYQFFYVAVALLRQPKESGQGSCHRLAVLIAARNESAVIGALLESLRMQNYPPELVDVYVGADNCTDDTAAVARAHGAIVYERTDAIHIGKGYVLNFLLHCIAAAGRHYDAYVVLDADNILDPDFLREIDRVHSDGYEIVTCYRNSKNYGDNWISAGYALWFLREARYLNGARMTLGSSCAVSGTDFLFSDRVLRSCGGWNFFLLTEDIEFTIANVTRGVRIGYAGRAVLYDEQPTSFRQSWRQRLRWSRGYLQVFGRYGGALFAGMLRGSFSCYDMAMNIMPAAVLTGTSVVVNVGAAISRFVSGGSMAALGVSVLQTLLSLYLTLFILGAITTASEWRSIHCAERKKLLYAFTFPLFMLTYIPICIASLFVRVEWKPIRHERAMTLEQIKSRALGTPQ